MPAEGAMLGQWRVLFGHFLKSYFYGESDPGADNRWGQIYLILIVIAACNFYSAWTLFSNLAAAFSLEKIGYFFSYLLALQMIISGIVALVSWHNLFLSAIDCKNLSHLPVSTLAIVLAKIFSVFSVVIILSLIHIISITPAVLYFSLRAVGLAPVRYSWAIFRFVIWGNVWIFFVLSSLLGTCQYLAKRRFLRWLPQLFQMVGLSLLFGILFYLPKIMITTAESLAGAEVPLLLRIPFLFVRQLQRFLRLPDSGASSERLFLAFSSAAAVFSTLFLIWIMFQRFNANSLERTPAQSKNSGGKNSVAVIGLIDRLFKNPPERGLFFFMAKTFFRNGVYWIFLVLLLAPLLGIFTVRTFFAGGEEAIGFFRGGPSKSILFAIAIGFMLVLFTVMIFRQAVSAKADWLWQSLPSISLAAVYRAMLKFLFLVFFIPLWSFLILIFIHYWTFSQALSFCVGFWPPFVFITFTLAFMNGIIIPFTGLRRQESQHEALTSWPFHLLLSIAYILLWRWLALRLIGVPMLLIPFILTTLFFIVKLNRRFAGTAFFSDEVDWFYAPEKKAEHRR